MEEEPKPAPGAEPVPDYRQPPRGVFSQHAQRWLFLGISGAVIVTILLFGPEPPENAGDTAPAEPAAEREPPSPQDDVDQRLALHDIRGSLAHAQMLAKIGVLDADEHAAIVAGLGTIRAEIEAGTFEWSIALEDVHMTRIDIARCPAE